MTYSVDYIYARNYILRRTKSQYLRRILYANKFTIQELEWMKEQIKKKEKSRKLGINNVRTY